MPILDMSKPTGLGSDFDRVLELMSSLWDNEQDPEMADLFSRLGSERDTAQQGAANAQQQLTSAINAPRPETNAAADVATRGIARAASGLLRSEKPQQQNEEMIKQKQAFMLEQREENLKRLGESYKRAADRAERLGDLEKEIKFKEQFDKVTEQRKELADTLRLGYQQTHQDLRSQISAWARSQYISGAFTENQLNAMETLLNSGQIENMRGIPVKAYGAIAERAVAQGHTLVSKTVRDAIAKVGDVERIFDDMHNLFSKIPAGKEGDLVSRGQAGWKAKWEAFKQSPGMGIDAKEYETARQGFKARVSQALGQVGVLTERDVQTALGMLPLGGWDTGEYGDRQFLKMKRFLNEKYESWYRTHTQPNAGLGEPGAQEAPASPAGELLKYLPKR